MFKFKKIASVLTSAIMVSSTVALAAAANYPAPFVKNGMADVGVVWGGSDAAPTDLVAASDISTSLSNQLTKQSTSSTTVSSTGTSISGGDFVKLEKSTDKFNLGDTMSGVFGATVDDDDLEELLADGTYMNDENTEYSYDQKLTLQALQLTHFADSDYNDKEPTIGFNIADGTTMLNYTLDFTTDAESDVTSGDLVDFETTNINILGKNYYVLDAKNGTSAANFGVFTLLDSANSAIVSEGETQTVSVGDKRYDVSINFVGTSSVKLDINGEITNSLNAGQTFKLSDGTYVGIKDILVQDYAGGIKKVEFSLGSGKLEIVDGSEIELNDDSVDGLTGRFVRGTPSSDKQRLDKLVITWAANDQEFLTGGNEVLMPAFEAVKFSTGDFVVPSAEKILVDYSGDDSIELNIPIKDGSARFNILYANSTGEFTGIGKDSDELLRTSSSSSITFNESIDDWFVATYNTTSDAESYLLSAKVTESDGRNRTTIRNEVTGQDVCKDKIAGDSCDIGDVSLTVSTVYKSGTGKHVTLTAGTNVNFNTIFSADGLKVYLPYSSDNGTAKGAIDFDNVGTATGHNSDTFLVFFDEENKDDDKGAGKSFNVTLNDDSDGDVEVSVVTANGGTLHDVPGTNDDTVGRVTSDLATEVKRIVSSDRGKAEITYSGSEAYAEVYITAPSASVSGDGSTVTSIVPIMDTEVSSASGKNLIVVGGSCINSVAASLLGSSSALCGDGFTSSTGVASGEFLIQTFSRDGGKVATLVAGYNAGDTTNAATYLRTQTVDTTVGKKYKGTSATSAESVVA